MLPPPRLLGKWDPLRIVCGTDEEREPSEGVSRALLHSRMLVYTASPMEEMPGEDQGIVCTCGNDEGCERHLEVQCELVCDSALQCLMLEHAPVRAVRVLVRDSAHFEGTIECRCESLGDGIWLVTLGEHATHHATGKSVPIEELSYPVRFGFCSRGGSPALTRL